MNAWWKVGLIVAYTLFVASIVWRGHTILDESRQTVELTAEIAQHQLDQKAADDHAADLEKSLAAERQKSQTLDQQWQAQRLASTTDCKLSHEAITILHQATSPR